MTDIRKHYAFSPDNPVVRDVLAGGGVVARLLCFEPGQLMELPRPGLCYVVEGAALFGAAGRESHVSAGGIVVIGSAGEARLSNPGPGRLVVLHYSADEPGRE